MPSGVTVGVVEAVNPPVSWGQPGLEVPDDVKEYTVCPPKRLLSVPTYKSSEASKAIAPWLKLGRPVFHKSVPSARYALMMLNSSIWNIVPVLAIAEPQYIARELTGQFGVVIPFA
jgi:hypothetical protein